ncbi:MAG TPA: hypothetical protein VGC65_09380 [Bacteroidia bacterium]|jgi:hypothetical protein
MLSISTENDSIYFLMERADVLFSDFSIDHIVAFDHDDNFQLVIYTFKNKNFICFSAEAYLEDSDALPALLQLIQEYADANPSALLEKAMKILENKLHSENNGRFYFDAH